MGVFSQKVLDEIRTVQEMIGQPILSETIQSEATEASSASSNMINTTGFSSTLQPPALGDDNLHE